MKKYNVITLKHSWKNVLLNWRKVNWQDPVRDKFEKTDWNKYSATVSSTLDELEMLMEEMEKIKSDVENLDGSQQIRFFFRF
jgi:hypothetical protein